MSPPLPVHPEDSPNEVDFVDEGPVDLDETADEDERFRQSVDELLKKLEAEAALDEIHWAAGGLVFLRNAPPRVDRVAKRRLDFGDDPVDHVAKRRLDFGDDPVILPVPFDSDDVDVYAADKRNPAPDSPYSQEWDEDEEAPALKRSRNM